MELQAHARVVLGVLYVEGPSHGFALARLLSPAAEFGRVWSMARPQVYRAIEQLTEAGCATAGEVEAGVRGPGRTPYSPTRAGKRIARRWLEDPVLHLRDARTELLVKVLLRDRLGLPRLPFVDRQYATFHSLAAALTARCDANPGDVVAMWRAETARGVLAATERLRVDVSSA